MTPWRWTAYCLFTFALAALAFRFAVDPPHMLAVGVAAVVLGVLSDAPDLDAVSAPGPGPSGRPGLRCPSRRRSPPNPPGSDGAGRRDGARRPRPSWFL